MEPVGLGSAHVHQLTASRHQRRQQLTLRVGRRRDVLVPVLVPRENVGEVA